MRRAVIVLFALSLWSFAASSQESHERRILVYGATGNVGSLVVAEALDRGHHVTAVSRDASQLETRHDNLTVVTGDLLDPESIASLAANQDVIIVSVRGIVGDSKSPENTIQRIAIENVIDVLSDMGSSAPRVIHVGGAGTLEVEPGVIYADTIRRLFIPKSIELEIDGQVLVLEYLRTVTDVEWTYATPPTRFTNGQRTGEFRLGGDQLLEDERGRSEISRADFAVALVNEAENGSYINQRFSVAY